ncbi:Eco47II family restriction endonuclease [Photobacterium swingsii]|uniref:Eco47II family restriction endonuclease n=1 Tax=Photobacterium swingsii TaxID=680026 RepID=UPI004068AA41
MPILNFISDENLRAEVKFVIGKALAAKQESDKKFGKNVIDPFSAIFEIASFDVDHNEWKKNESIRQAQKSLQNHVGMFHQKILGHVQGWEDKGVGSIVDLICDKKKIVAEVKNKYSTVTGSKLADLYKDLADLVNPKHSNYKGYTAYVVNIIPRRAARMNQEFTPSDRGKGQKCPPSELIRIIDGYSFYEMVTGEPDALEQLFKALPSVIEDILVNDFERKIDYKVPDILSITDYFDKAYRG